MPDSQSGPNRKGSEIHQGQDIEPGDQPEQEGSATRQQELLGSTDLNGNGKGDSSASGSKSAQSAGGTQS
jgi:hypothetical protein